MSFQGLPEDLLLEACELPVHLNKPPSSVFQFGRRGYKNTVKERSEMCTGFGKLLGRGQPIHIRDFRLPMEHSSIRDWQDAAEKLTTAESPSPAAF